MFNTLSDVLLLLSLALNAYLVWYIGRKATIRSDAPAEAPPRPTSEGDLSRVRDVLHADGKIQAIKLYRELTGAGLLDAKNAVEALERS